MIRVGNPKLFSFLPVGLLAPFPDVKSRNVRVTFLCAQPVTVSLVGIDPNGEFSSEEPQLLAPVEGMVEVEFYADGPFALVADGDVYLKTVDGDKIHAVVPDAETFTRIHERRARDPEIERLEMMLLKNQERRMAAMMESQRRETQRIHDAYARANDSRASAEGGNPPVPEQAPRTGEPAPSPETPKGGNEGGEGDAKRT